MTTPEFRAKWLALSDAEWMQRVYPIGTEDECCFVCEHSSTNPELIATAPERHTARASRSGLMHCFRFALAGHVMHGYNCCGEFLHRGDPPRLPPAREING